MRLICLLTLLALDVLAQQIHGSVTEFGTNRPIMDAVVSLRPATPGYNGPNLDTTTTDVSGVFEFVLEKLGRYVVEVKKDGYPSSFRTNRSVPSSVAVELDPAHLMQEVHLVLSPPGSISGNVVDEESGKPVPDLRMSSWRTLYMEGERTLLPGGFAFSNAEGQFITRSAAAGDYVFEVMAIEPGPKRLMATFAPSDLLMTDLGYPVTFWPGGTRDISMAGSVTVTPEPPLISER